MAKTGNRPHKNRKISDEKRQDIIFALERGSQSRNSVAESFNVPYSTVCTIYSQFLLTNKLNKGKKGCSKPKKLTDSQVAFLKQCINENCSLTLKELRMKILDEFAISISEPTISKYIQGFNFSMKRLNLIAQAAVTPELQAARREYSSWMLHCHNEGRNVIFIDETGFQITMRRFHGRSQIGTRAISIVPALRTRNKTVIAAFSRVGLLLYHVLERAGNRVNFNEFISELCVVLNTRDLRDCTLIMDNVRFHHCAEIEENIKSNGHNVKFLPPYSPFFNPIENLFSQWKNIVRGRSPNNENELNNAINGFQNIISSENCQNYIQHIVNNCILCLSGAVIIVNN